jgi:diguanylate cyclase (GGDEF)-like protein
VASIDANLYPQLYDLALYLAAEAEAGTGLGAGLRYGRRQLSEHWARRLASLGAMQSRVQAERLSTERELLSKHARLDDLTGIGNRRALEQYLTELERLDVASIALILLDVDAFKEVNDGHGHLAGDAVLVGIARALERSIRPCDLAVRLGGDEFAVVLADVDLDAAFERAAAFLALIDEQHFEEASPGLVVALSAGVATGAPARMAELRAEADAALYRAKAGGGRRVLRSRVARAVA